MQLPIVPDVLCPLLLLLRRLGLLRLHLAARDRRGPPVHPAAVKGLHLRHGQRRAPDPETGRTRVAEQKRDPG